MRVADPVAWLADDPDPVTRGELESLIAAADNGDAAASAELDDAFATRLEFGTAGLRGRMGAGPNRMNQVVVAQAAAGLAQYVLEHGGGAVVLGHDARHQSDVFARISAEVLSGAGLSVLMLPARLPTPLLAFAIRYLGASAGVMVTASHNPAADNGYKVYLGDGSQIVPPVDSEISAHIEAVAAQPLASIPRGDEWVTIGDDVIDAYVAKASALVEPGPPLHLRLAYTAMHGVGGRLFLRVLEDAGFAQPVVVEPQFEPDPDFPTVPFPNPEEPGAMDLALAAAADADCDLVIAHDPDADRCAVGVPGPGGWRRLSGDEVGWLLGWWIAAGNRRLNRQSVFAQSIVSGTMLEAIAADANIGYAQTLTGFKWIGRIPHLAFGYEEALGYCVDPNGVRDKDGISAGVMVAEMAARLKSRGSSLLQVLDELAARHGVHATRQLSVRVAGPEQMDSVMERLRAHPPTAVAGITVERFDDMSRSGGDLPPTDALRFALTGGARIIVRPSGTEPKVKCYLQSVRPVTESLAAAQQEAAAELDAMSAEVARWLE